MVTAMSSGHDTKDWRLDGELAIGLDMEFFKRVRKHRAFHAKLWLEY
jgi:hypothetical protein